MTKYIRNEDGGVASVTDEHFENVLHETSEGGRRYLKHGFSEISETEARKAHPQLFGAPDPQISYTQKELAEAVQRKQMLDELHEPNVGA